MLAAILTYLIIFIQFDGVSVKAENRGIISYAVPDGFKDDDNALAVPSGPIGYSLLSSNKPATFSLLGQNNNQIGATVIQPSGPIGYSMLSQNNQAPILITAQPYAGK